MRCTSANSLSFVPHRGFSQVCYGGYIFITFLSSLAQTCTWVGGWVRNSSQPFLTVSLYKISFLTDKVLEDKIVYRHHLLINLSKFMRNPSVVPAYFNQSYEVTRLQDLVLRMNSQNKKSKTTFYARLVDSCKNSFNQVTIFAFFRFLSLSFFFTPSASCGMRI